MTEHLIIGGGIAGLYLAYKLNSKNIVILEKSGRLGGRILTIDNKGFKYESGAGRVGKKQKLIMKLIKELGFSNSLIRTQNKKHYFLKNKYFKSEKKLLDFYKIKKYNSIREIWLKILKCTTKKKEELLKNINLYTYLFTILNENEVELITDTMGYISELLDYNAYNAINTLKNDFDLVDNEFYVLAGGLEKIINKLENILIGRGVQIFNNHLLKNFTDNKNSNYSKKAIIETFKGQKKINCNNIYFTVKKSDYMKIKYFKPNISLFRSSVTEGNLMRIYAKYPTKKDKSWFDDIPKVITDNPILYIIPISIKDGLIMISYSDKYFADFWDNLGGDKEILKMLNFFLKKIFPKKNIPKPEWITTHFWKGGVHYWKPKVDSTIIKTRFENLYFQNNIYICGETYSNNQGWIEGSLKSVKEILDFKKKQSGGYQEKKTLKKFTLKEVEDKNKKNPDQIWAIIKNRKDKPIKNLKTNKYYVLNLTNWIKKHPGGQYNITKIRNIKNYDATDLFYGNPNHGIESINALFNYVVGYLDKNLKGGKKKQFWEMNIEELKNYVEAERKKHSF